MTKQNIIRVVALIIAIIALFTPQGQKVIIDGMDALGATGTRFPNGLSADSTSPAVGELRGTDLTITDDATISGGVLSVPTAANATSTLTVGEIEMYATSSATAICLKFSTIATSSSPVSNNGHVLWAYGSCP